MSDSLLKKVPFSSRTSVEQVEESDQLSPKFDEKGCIPCITTHAETNEVLMFAFMNAEALRLTISSGLAHYWSRSRNMLWKKGETSGMFQEVHRILIDDDQDCVWLRVSVGGNGASCHVGYRSCFYRSLPTGALPNAPVTLTFEETEKVFDPLAVYGDAPNPTKF